MPARHLSGVTHPEPGALDAAILRTLREVAATHIVLAGYMKKRGPLTLQAFAGQVFNTHPALLPAFGGQGMFGRNVHRAVLESGVSTTGATVHHVQADYDTGPIISQTEVAVSDAHGFGQCRTCVPSPGRIRMQRPSSLARDPHVRHVYDTRPRSAAAEQTRACRDAAGA